MSSVYHNILVALDGSADADRALEQAVELARDQHARLTLVTVVPPLSGLAAMTPSAGEQAIATRRGHEQLLREATDRMPEDIGVTTLLLDGHPARRIIESAREHGHDLIVMGSHGRGRVGTALLGSVSQQVVHHACVPVLVCHAQRVAA